MQILAHRANMDGPNLTTENTVAAVESAFREGFGVETDLRRDPKGRFYISHDPSPWTEAADFAAFEECFRTNPALCVAMNVKELGYESALIELQTEGSLGGSSFLFDFELLEPAEPGRTQRLIRSLANGGECVLAARLSDRNEDLNQCLAIPAQVAWIDEFDSTWITVREIHALRASGRLIYAVSPELHQFDDATRLRRWSDFRSWGIDGICTDYALAARDFFAR
jgi:hypothetical protein